MRIEAAREGLIRQSSTFIRLRLVEPLLLPRDHEFAVVAERHPMLPSKPLCPRRHKIDMRRFIQHQSCRANRISQPLHTRHAASAKILAIHQERIHLHAAILRQKRASPGIEGLIVFHYGDRGLHRVHRAGALLQKRIAGRESVGYASFVVSNGVVGHGPGATVN